MKACYDTIRQEERELQRISEEIDRTRELIVKFDRSIAALKILESTA